MEPIMYRAPLPQTGYVVIHTANVDGEPAPERPTLVFIHAADDDAAVAAFDADTDMIARNAPRNVAHVRRLVHRTDASGAGDRVIAEATTRGPGAPFTPF